MFPPARPILPSMGSMGIAIGSYGHIENILLKKMNLGKHP
jgi:hypothetical protein